MLHIPLTNCLLLTAKQEPCKKTLTNTQHPVNRKSHIRAIETQANQLNVNVRFTAYVASHYVWRELRKNVAEGTLKAEIRQVKWTLKAEIRRVEWILKAEIRRLNKAEIREVEWTLKAEIREVEWTLKADIRGWMNFNGRNQKGWKNLKGRNQRGSTNFKGKNQRSRIPGSRWSM